MRTKQEPTYKILLAILLAFIIIQLISGCSGRAWEGQRKTAGGTVTIYSNGWPWQQSCSTFSNPQPMKKTNYNRYAYPSKHVKQ